MKQKGDFTTYFVTGISILVVIIVLAFFFGQLIQWMATLSSPSQQSTRATAAVEARIAPIGRLVQAPAAVQVTSATANTSQVNHRSTPTTTPPAADAMPTTPVSTDLEVAELAEGEALYNQVCQACHQIGAAGAPKFGDTAAWQPRLERGLTALYDSVLNGKGAMPPKGGAMTASDAQIRAAVDYLLTALPD